MAIYGWTTWTFKLIEKKPTNSVSQGWRKIRISKWQLGVPRMSSFFRYLGPFAFFFSCLAAKKNEKMKMMKIWSQMVGCWKFFALGKNQYPPDAPIYGLFMERRWKRRPHSRGPNVGKMAEAMACFDEMFPDWMHPDEVGPFWHNTPREVEENTGGQDEKWNMCVFFRGV